MHDKRGEVEDHPPLAGRRNPWRCEAEQARGRRPYLVTGALVLRSSLHANKSGDKDVGGALTRAGISPGCYADEVLICDYSSCADRLRSACNGRPVPVELARVIHWERRAGYDLHERVI